MDHQISNKSEEIERLMERPFVPVAAVNDSRIASWLGSVPPNSLQQLTNDPVLAMEEHNKEAFAHHQRSFLGAKT